MDKVGRGLEQRNNDGLNGKNVCIGRKVTLLHEKYNRNSKIKAYIAIYPKFILNSQLLIYNKEFGSMDICSTSYIVNINIR